jgi:putative transposase
MRIAWHYIAPGQADPERLHRKLQRPATGELLNETLFPSLSHVRATVAPWRADYNLNRPHSRLGWLTPAEYADTFNPRRDLALRSMASSTPAPVAHPAQMGKTSRQSLHHAG